MSERCGALIGRTITAIVWDNEPTVGSGGEVDSNQIAGFELAGGEVVSFSGSPQIDVDAVWIVTEDMAGDAEDT